MSHKDKCDAGICARARWQNRQQTDNQRSSTKWQDTDHNDRMTQKKTQDQKRSKDREHYAEYTDTRCSGQKL
jgi:hypothetical protein